VGVPTHIGGEGYPEAPTTEQKGGGIKVLRWGYLRVMVPSPTFLSGWRRFGVGCWVYNFYGGVYNLRKVLSFLYFSKTFAILSKGGGTTKTCSMVGCFCLDG